MFSSADASSGLLVFDNMLAFFQKRKKHLLYSLKGVNIYSCATTALYPSGILKVFWSQQSVQGTGNMSDKTQPCGQPVLRVRVGEVANPNRLTTAGEKIQNLAADCVTDP